METIHFLGYILPETVKVSVHHSPLLKWEAPEHGIPMEYMINIADSKIDVECKVSEYRQALLAELRMRALDLCRASINLVAFQRGFGLTTILDTFVDPTGLTSIVQVHNPRLEAACTAFSLDSTFDEIHTLVRQDVHLSVVLNDLITALTMTHTAQINCARALDGLKHRIAAPGSKDPAAWRQMREALNLSEDYLKFITDRSTDPRHGKLPIISENDANEILLRAWTVVNRYFEHLKRKGAPLPQTEFPILAA